MSQAPTPDEMMSAYAEDGVAYAQQAFGVALDYSEGSVELVEGVLSKLYEAKPKGFLARLLGQGPSVRQIDQISKALGGYVGEVMRRHWGGHWKLESQAFPAQPVITLRLPNGSDIWKHFKVGKRLTNGEENNVWHYFQVMRQEHHSPSGAA